MMMVGRGIALNVGGGLGRPYENNAGKIGTTVTEQQPKKTLMCKNFMIK